MMPSYNDDSAKVSFVNCKQPPTPSVRLVDALSIFCLFVSRFHDSSGLMMIMIIKIKIKIINHKYGYLGCITFEARTRHLPKVLLPILL